MANKHMKGLVLIKSEKNWGPEVQPDVLYQKP